MNKESSNKREVPPILKNILSKDVYLTDQLVKLLDKIKILKQLKVYHKMLEITCSGLLWIPCWTAFIWVLMKKNLFQMQINFLIGLLLDALLVAVIKSYVRRRRPTDNEDSRKMGFDKFSFPSGHVAKAFYTATFFLYDWPVHFIFVPPLLCWSISVSISKLLMKKHYLLDIVAGAILGITEALLIGLLYLESETCIDLVYWLTDEKLDGGEYHV